METNVIKVFENIGKSAELVFEHYRTRGFKNTLIEVGLNNIIALAQEGIKLVEQGKKEE